MKDFLFLWKFVLFLCYVIIVIGILLLIVLVFLCLLLMVREFSDSRLSRFSTGYYVFSMKCTAGDEVLVHFHAVVHGKQMDSVHADFISPELSLAAYCNENRVFLSYLQRYILSGMSAVRQDAAIDSRLAGF